MTREEAIKELESGYPKDDTPTEECVRYKEAIDMAIEALKREQKALELKPLVRNISGWNEMVNEISKLSKGDTLEEGDKK